MHITAVSYQPQSFGWTIKGDAADAILASSEKEKAKICSEERKVFQP
jgi:hypothetical protein